MLELTEKGIMAVREHETFRLSMLNDALSRLSADEAEKFVASLDNIKDFLAMRHISSDIDFDLCVPPDRIYQGGMGVGISMSSLAAAVAVCGGTGVIAATEIGYKEKDYEKDPLTANKRVLEREVKEALNKVKRLGGTGCVGVNILCTMKNYEDYVKAAVEAGAQAIISGGGVPTALPGICKDSRVKLIPVVSSARACSVILKNWDKKYNRTPDAFIFEGPLAGGHLGFKEEQMGQTRESFCKTIAEIKAELKNIPECLLIVGGGIYNKRDAQIALACGADGIQIGSRFVTTKECDGPQAFKEAYINCSEADIITIKSFGGRVDRVISNNFTESIKNAPRPMTSCIGCIVTCEQKEARFCMREALINSAKGDVKNGLIFCGGKAWKADKIETVRDVFDEFIL